MSFPPERPRNDEGFARGSRPRRHHCASAVQSAPPSLDDRTRLIFFTTATSGPCRRAESWIAQVLQHRRNHQKVKLITVDAATRPDLVSRFNVERLPTLFVVEEKVAKAKLECPRGSREINALLAPWLL
jgi:thiol-disulfide isomerase/thioredoxin